MRSPVRSRGTRTKTPGRLCMVLLHKAHIGEIQASIWPEDMRQECKELGMPLI